MIYLIDKVLPESYFVNNLRALSVDMAVFRDLLRLKLPELSQHLDILQRTANKESGGSGDSVLLYLWRYLFYFDSTVHLSLNLEWKYFFSGISVSESTVQWNRLLENKNRTEKLIGSCVVSRKSVKKLILSQYEINNWNDILPSRWRMESMSYCLVTLL